MAKIIRELRVGKYLALGLDNPLPWKSYLKYRIDGKEYEIVPLYDMPNSIAVESSESLLGKVVEFI